MYENTQFHTLCHAFKSLCFASWAVSKKKEDFYFFGMELIC